MNKILKSIALTGTILTVSLANLSSIVVRAENLDNGVYDFSDNQENVILNEEEFYGFPNEEMSARFSSTTEDWRVVSSSEKIISSKYTGTIEKTSTVAFNLGVNIKGVDFGTSKSYSKAKKFKTYRRVRDVTAKFAVYTRMGHFLRYETQTKRITTTHHVGI